jgi:CHASE2 domain-containing sensor protein
VDTFLDPHVVRRRHILLAGLVPTVICAALALHAPALLTRVDLGVYDTLVRFAGTDAPAGRIVIVDIDERSLFALGQWPWRRNVVGTLIDRLRAMDARTIALDIMFPEPDRGEGIPGNGATETLPASPDAALAETLRAGQVVLGYAFTFGEAASGSQHCVLHPLSLTIVQPAADAGGSPLFHASDAICSLPILAQAAGASGFLNAAPDSDGILRRVPLVLELDGRVYPGLALAAVTAAADPRSAELRVANANTTSLEVGDLTVPLDGRGNLLLRYRGHKRAFPYVSAADVLAGRLPDDTFRDKIVLVGATALGTQELVATPYDPSFFGVEVQATVADNLLREDFIRRPEHALILEALIVLGLGIGVALAIGRIGVVWGGLAAVAWLIFLWGGMGWLLAAKGVFLSPLFPTLGVTAALAATNFAALTDERWRGRRAGEERAAISQRLMVQTLLSLVEVRDTETGRHSRRMQRYVSVLGEQLSANPKFRDYLTPERIDQIASLAPLHDIGKVGISDQLLKKSGQLTEAELAEMRRHPAYGRDVIAKAERQVGVHDDAILALAKDIVYTHHERWDGTGYPQGMRGEQIPIPGRLVALVDVYDALISRRVYRPPLVHDRAVDLILEGRGTHFDPAVVDAFVGIAPVLENLSNEGSA